MAKYLDVFFHEELLVNASVTVSEANAESACVYVDLMLGERGIDPATVSLPNAVLTEIAKHWALHLACIEGALGDNSPLREKAKEYEAIANALSSRISREALGLASPVGTAFRQITLGRG